MRSHSKILILLKTSILPSCETALQQGHTLSAVAISLADCSSLFSLLPFHFFLPECFSCLFCMDFFLPLFLLWPCLEDAKSRSMQPNFRTESSDYNGSPVVADCLTHLQWTFEPQFCNKVAVSQEKLKAASTQVPCHFYYTGVM